MTYLGIDYGEKRIGLACGDSEVGVATPLPAATAPQAAERFRQIGRYIEQRRPAALIVGYPLNMDGSTGFKAREVDAFMAELAQRFGLPVHAVDERLSSRQAAQSAPGAKRKHRSPRQVRAERASGQLDSRAAAIILQDYLDGLALQAGIPPPADSPEP